MFLAKGIEKNQIYNHIAIIDIKKQNMFHLVISYYDISTPYFLIVILYVIMTM